MNISDEMLDVRTSRRNEMVDITSQVAQVVEKSSINDGMVTVFCPHTTAGVTISENADPDVPHDILLTLEGLIPQHRSGYRHCEGNSDSHVKSSLVGASEHVCVKDGRLVLGTWQAIFFCEFDGPRNRRVFVQVRG